jgi:hypothetical protein
LAQPEVLHIRAMLWMFAGKSVDLLLQFLSAFVVVFVLFSGNLRF